MLFVLKILNLRTKWCQRQLYVNKSTAHTRFEIFNVFRRNLCNLKETHLTVIVYKSTTLKQVIYPA
jgi:hypothetical protein